MSNLLRNTTVGQQVPLTPQTQQAHPAQVPNHAGGFAFQVDDWRRMERFLILGSDGGTYYVDEKPLTQEAAQAVKRCIDQDGPRAVQMIVDISEQGRAYRNTPAVFALALAASSKDLPTRQAALAALPKVCRIATHLFEFLEASASKKDGTATRTMRGWGPAFRKAVGRWYTSRDADSLATQLLKYRQRGNWSHHAALHLCHAKPQDQEQSQLFKLSKLLSSDHRNPKQPVSYEGNNALARDFLALQESESVPLTVSIIQRQSAVTWEMIPTEQLGSPEIWAALLQRDMPITALIRNLGRMTANGLLKAGQGNLPVKGSFNAVAAVLQALGNEEKLRKGRVHPVQCLAALLTYKAGHGGKGKLTWTPVPEVTAALDRAFYACFKYVQPTGKNFLYGIDVSGSMCSPDLMNVPGLSPRVGSAAMAMAIARVEPNYAFMGFSHELVPLNITPLQSLEQVIQTIDAIPMGGTDCALPIKFAHDRKLVVDMFVTITDSETWAGRNGHPHEWLEKYRRQMNRPAKNVVVGMTATDISIANPQDPGMLDVTGFDASVPSLIADFARAEI